MLRVALSHRTTTPAADWVFEQQPGAKPRIANAPPTCPDFSLSHTSGMAVCALSGIGPVGVDVESVERGDDVLEIAANRFANPEHRYLDGLPEGERREAAVWMWTAKEAILKATGQGLGAPLSSVLVTGYPGQETRVRTDDESVRGLIPFRFGDVYLGTMALGSEKVDARQIRVLRLEEELDRPRLVQVVVERGILHIPI